jgi:hypothetical protein
MKKIKDPWIAKEQFSNLNLIKERLDYDKWVKYIEKNSNYYVWYENTIDGIYLRENIDKVPEWAREGILNSSKEKVLAEFNNKKGYYEIVLQFNKEFGVISSTYMRKITKEHLMRLLEMANYLNGFLLNNGNEIIDERIIGIIK